MSKKIGLGYHGGPAFVETADTTRDITLRDYFAGQLVAGVFANFTLLEAAIDAEEHPTAAIAKVCYDAADAMIAERNKETSE